MFRVTTLAAAITLAATLFFFAAYAAEAADTQSVSASTSQAKPTAQPTVESPGQPLPTFRDCPDCAEMVVVPAGSFMMGSTPVDDIRLHVPDRLAGREMPQHKVTVASFAIGRYPVTRGEFKAFVAATGYDPSKCYVFGVNGGTYDVKASWRKLDYVQTDRHPVVCVSYDDAQAYVKWLSAKTGKMYRLPSEAEWEYAARAGTTTARFWGDDPSVQCTYANGADLSSEKDYPVLHGADCQDGYVFTSPVGTYQPNAWGLYDMLGNVWEWTADCPHVSYIGAPTDGSAWTTVRCGIRVVRGGSWSNNPQVLRVSARDAVAAAERSSNYGFRVVRNPG